MTSSKVFCNTPWYEAHIYWDGSLGICCQESRKLYSESHTEYNIKNMSLAEWFNSEPVRQFRSAMLDQNPISVCSRCYNEEAMGGTSRRHRSNQKSVIFTRTAFTESLEQSPGYRHFKFSQDNDGVTNTLPIDLHIDLGNYCNLACKMCWAGASSTIAVQNVQWGVEEDRKYLGTDWTKDTEVWSRFLAELLTIPKLKNIHFMGGETLLTPRFEEFVDFMIVNNRFDLSFSFVTNGTVFKPTLMDKLKQFARVGIEVSIETTTQHNSYVRQGTDTAEVLAIIQRYLTYCNNTTISLTVRPAISALTIGHYHTLLEYCLEHKLLIKSLIVTDPTFLNVNVLPKDVRLNYVKNYLNLLDRLADVHGQAGDFNESDPNNYLNIIKLQTQQAINLLNSTVSDSIQIPKLVEHCAKWDKVYKLNLLELYPEFKKMINDLSY
jgi:uncharacterized Fe-S cluster-containing radical SAM superfamily protein